MPRNAAGIYTLPNAPVVPDTTITSPDENGTRNDIAAELTNSLDRNGRGGMLAPFKIADGDVTTPGLGFLNDPNCGLYRIGADDIAVSVGGVKVMELIPTSITIPVIVLLTIAGAAGFSATGLNACPIGAATPSSGAFTTLSATQALTALKAADGFIFGAVKKLYFFDDGSGISIKTAPAQAGTGFYIQDSTNTMFLQIGGTGTVAQLTATGLNSCAIGATTKSTGAFAGLSCINGFDSFDTLNAQVRATVAGTANALLGFNHTGGAYQGAPNDTAYIGTAQPYDISVIRAGVEVARFISTGIYTGAIGTQGASAFNVLTNNITRMSIDSAGNALFNFSTTVNLTIAGVAFVAANITAASTTCQIINKAVAGDNIFATFYTEASPTARGSIDYNRVGGVTRYNTSSDEVLKIIKGPADPKVSTDILRNTQLMAYAYRDNPLKEQIGVIAQQVYASGFKGAVSVGGTDDKGDYVPWGVDKTAWTFHMIAGWQDHDARISKLESAYAT